MKKLLTWWRRRVDEPEGSVDAVPRLWPYLDCESKRRLLEERPDALPTILMAHFASELEDLAARHAAVAPAPDDDTGASSTRTA